MERNFNDTPGSYTVEGVGRSYTPWMDCSNKNFSNFDSGIYLIEININGMIRTEKVIIQ